MSELAGGGFLVHRLALFPPLVLLLWVAGGRFGRRARLVVPLLAATLALAQRVYVINNGHVVHEGPAAELKGRPELLQRWLGV